MIIYGRTVCSICSEVLNIEDSIIITSHFISDKNDPLWPYSDSGMHKECFLAWSQRQEFIKRFNQIVGKQKYPDGGYRRMGDDGTIEVVYVLLSH